MSLLSNQILKNPANYMYLFADYESFITKLDRKTQEVIVVKRTYQEKIICNELGIVKPADDRDLYNKAMKELSDSFVGFYGITPGKALVKLANGEEVAGKNWSAGMYGVGAIKVNTFEQNKSITVNPDTGEISKAGQVVSSSATAIVGVNKKHGNVIGYTYTDENGDCYTSTYNKTAGKYYCGTKTDASGNITRADGSVGSNADMSSLWQSIIGGLTDLLLSLLDKIKEKLLPGQKILDPTDVVPEQKDGFVTEDNGSNVVPILIAGGVAIALAAPSIKKAVKKSK